MNKNLTTISILVMAAICMFGVTSRNSVFAAGPAVNKAVLIDISSSRGSSREDTPWIKNGADRIAEAFEGMDDEFSFTRFGNMSSEGVAAFETAIAEKPSGANKDRTLIVYWTGFALKSATGDANVRFALSDYDATNPDQTSISLKKLCDTISKTPYSTKILVLDTFPFDGAHNPDAALLEKLTNSGNVYLLSSSKDGIHGHFWETQNMSLFAFWFAEGITGSADRSLDGRITLTELADFLSMSVNNLANALGISQTTANLQMQKSGLPDSIFLKNPFVASVKPKNKADAIELVARQFAVVIPCYGINRVAVPEFALAKGNKMQSARDDFISSPITMAKDLENRLVTMFTPDRCVVMPLDRLHNELVNESIEPESLLSDKSKSVLSKIMIDGKPLSSIIVGFYKKNSSSGKSNSLSFTCGLVDLTTMKPLLVSSCIVPETVSHMKPVTKFPVKIQVKNALGNYEDRDICYINERAYVQLSKGEVYQVVIWNLSGENVGFRVLVDGMNSHPEREDANTPGQELPGGISTLKKMTGQYVSQKLVPIDEANFWVLQPTPRNPDGTLPKGEKIKGFYRSIGQNSVYNEFTVSGVGESKAARSGYTDELGVITVGVYTLRPKKKSRGSVNRAVDSTDLGTKEGAERTGGEIRVYRGMEINEEKSLLHIHYVTPEKLQQLKEQL